MEQTEDEGASAPTEDEAATGSGNDVADEPAIGSVMLDEEELVAPVIQVKPNNAIPITIGALLILGGLMMGFSAYGNLFYSPLSDADVQGIVDGLSAQGSDITNEDVIGFFDDLQDAGYFSTLGAIEAISAVTLLAAGIMLVQRRALGVKIGFAGAGLVLLDAIVNFVLLSGVSSPDPMLDLTMRITAGLGAGCGLFCLALPAVPLFLSAGKAALIE